MEDGRKKRTGNMASVGPTCFFSFQQLVQVWDLPLFWFPPSVVEQNLEFKMIKSTNWKLLFPIPFYLFQLLSKIGNRTELCIHPILFLSPLIHLPSMPNVNSKRMPP